MARWLSLLVFLAVATALLSGIHYYLWLRLVRDVGWPGGTKRVLTGLVWVLALSVPLAIVSGRALSPDLSQWLVRPAYVWLGAMFLLLVGVAGLDVLRGLSSLVGLVAAQPVDPARRQTLARLVGLGAAAFGLGATGWSLREAAQVLVKRVEVPLRRLPVALDGMTIVQLSDVHVGPMIGRAFIEHIVSTVNGLQPDVIAITGDLVDGSVADLSQEVAPLAELRSKHGCYFVTGNHEYYSGAAPWCAHLPTLGIRVLRNEHVSIGTGEHHFHLAGVDDFAAARFGEGHGADLKKALVGRDPSKALVLLAHQPKAVHEAQEYGVDLQLSGHTHGGQLWPFNWIVKLQQPVVAGLKRFGETLIYVSCGTGYWGPPMRLRAPPEVTQVVLRAV